MRPLVELAFFTEDVPSLVTFYEELLGGSPAHQSEQMALFQLEGLHILIHHREPPDSEYETGAEGPPNEDHFAIGVKALVSAWEGSGLKNSPSAIAPATYPWGRSAYLRDPDGRLVEIQES